MTSSEWNVWNVTQEGVSGRGSEFTHTGVSSLRILTTFVLCMLVGVCGYQCVFVCVVFVCVCQCVFVCVVFFVCVAVCQCMFVCVECVECVGVC